MTSTTITRSLTKEEEEEEVVEETVPIFVCFVFLVNCTAHRHTYQNVDIHFMYKRVRDTIIIISQTTLSSNSRFYSLSYNHYHHWMGDHNCLQNVNNVLIVMLWNGIHHTKIIEFWVWNEAEIVRTSVVGVVQSKFFCFFFFFFFACFPNLTIFIFIRVVVFSFNCHHHHHNHY